MYAYMVNFRPEVETLKSIFDLEFDIKKKLASRNWGPMQCFFFLSNILDNNIISNRII